MRSILFFLFVQILCAFGFVLSIKAQTQRLSTQELSRNAHYSRQRAQVQPKEAYRLNPGMPVTGITLQIDTTDVFSGAYIVYQADTFYLEQDEHAPASDSLRQSSLVIFDKPVKQFLFYPASIRGEVTFAFLNANVGQKKSANDNLRKNQSPAVDKCQEPALVPQSEWREGLPTPSYTRQATQVEHVIVHHAATSNDLTNYENVVRNIYLLHTEVNGWSDIGYNYLIAQDGTIFAGRSAGNQSVSTDNIQGAHFCGKNSGTMGICLLGNYETAFPTDTAVASLVKLTGWKLAKENLDPLGESPHAGEGELATLAGHRNGCATLCPGEHLYERLPEIRLSVQDYIATDCQEAPTAFNIYPIPTDGELTIVLPGDAVADTLVLYDMMGRIHPVVSQVEDNKLVVDIQMLAAGVYTLQISGAGFEGRRKILVVGD